MDSLLDAMDWACLFLSRGIPSELPLKVVAEAMMCELKVF